MGSCAVIDREDLPIVAGIGTREKRLFGSSGESKQSALSKRSQLSNSWLAMGTELLRSTNIHGVKYILPEFSKSRRWDRIAWLFFVITAIIAIAYMVSKLLQKEGIAPLIISIQFEINPSNHTLFPAVTICNTDVIFRNRSLALLTNYGYNESESELILAMTNDMVALGQPRMPASQFDLEMHNLNLTMNNLLYLMYKQAQPCSEMFVQCAWQSRNFDCNAHIVSHLTDMGYCCIIRKYHSYFPKTHRSLSFPYKNGSGKALDIGIGPVKEKIKDHRDVMGRTNAGVLRGLSIVLKSRSNASSYLKVYIHHPGDAPNMYQRALPVPFGNQAFFPVRVSRTYTTDRTRNAYNSAIRHCYYREEGAVYNVNGYSVPNCQTACVIQKSMASCNCIPYYYAEKTNTTICPTSQYACLRASAKWNPMVQAFAPKCRLCKPGCAQTSYHTSVRRAPLRDMASPYAILHKVKNTTLASRHLALLNIYLADYLTILHKRDILYDWNDLLCGIGGLLSLGIGFCLIDVAEIVYFFTLRWFISL